MARRLVWVRTIRKKTKFGKKSITQLPDNPQIVMEHTGLERIVRLIGLLIGNRRTTSQLAELLDCDLRTIQRYVTLLKHTGFIVEYYTRGVPFLNARRGRLKDISALAHFSDEEACILHRAIDSIDGTNLLKQNLKKKLYSIYNFPEMADIIVKPHMGETVKRLLDAITQERCVVFRNYRSANSNTVSDRLVEPYQFTTNYQQVWCYEESRQSCKLFAVSRIGEVEPLHQRWKHKKLHQQVNVDVFRNSGSKPVGMVALQLNIRAASLLCEEYPLAENYMNDNGNGYSIFEMQVYRYEGPARFVLGLFDNITVLGDIMFIQFLRDKIVEIQDFNDTLRR